MKGAPTRVLLRAQVAPLVQRRSRTGAPRPRINLILYHGVLAPRAAWRRAVVPSRQDGDAAPAEPQACARCAEGLIELPAFRTTPLNLPRFNRHPVSHESAIGVCHEEANETVVLVGV